MIQKVKGSTVAIAYGNHEMLDQWAQELIEHTQMLGYHVIEICGSDLTSLTEILQYTKPAILFNFSYCTPNNLNETAVIVYAGDVKRRIAGSPAFIGFTENLIVVSDNYGTQNTFKELLLLLAKRILEGWTVGAAVYATRTDLSNAVRHYKGCKYISLPLFYNMKYLTQLGDPNWKLTPNLP